MKRVARLFIIAICCTLNSYGQISPVLNEEIEKSISDEHLPFYNKARLSIESKQYTEALPNLTILITIYPNNPYINYIAGIGYCFDQNRKSLAISFFRKATAEESKLLNLDYWKGLSYEVNDSIPQAKIHYSKFLNEKGNDPNTDSDLITNAKRKLNNLMMADKMKNYVNLVTVKSIGPPINSEASEYVPLLPSDESFMIFTYRGKLSKGGKQNVSTSILGSTKSEENYYFEDVFISNRINDTTWSEPKPIKSINTSLHDAAVTLSLDGTMLFIYKNLGAGNGDLYMSKLRGETWSVPVYQKGLNSDKWEGSAAFFPDNKHIIFSSERKGGYGGKDLYTAEMIGDNKWGNIVNLGSGINTDSDEDAPFISADGKTLFFASNGKLSTGGYDILRCDMTEKGWGKPYNLGKPVNTPYDDKFYITTGDGKRGYYSSFKEGGKGEQDIYYIQPGMIGKPVKLVQVSGNITYNEKPVEGSIKVSSLTNEAFKTIDNMSNSLTGKFLFNLPEDGDYELVFSYKNLPPQIKHINTIAIDSFIQLTVFADFYSDAYKKMLDHKKDSIDLVNKLTTKGMDLELFKRNYGDISMDSLSYKIQIGAFRFIENFNYNSTLRIGKIIRKVFNDGITRFTVGNYKTYNEADAILKSVKENAYKDAFIIVIYKNNYYYLNDIISKGVLKSVSGTK